MRFQILIRPLFCVSLLTLAPFGATAGSLGAFQLEKLVIASGATASANGLPVNGSVRVTNGAVFVGSANILIITPNGLLGITVSNTGVLSAFSIPCP